MRINEATKDSIAEMLERTVLDKTNDIEILRLNNSSTKHTSEIVVKYKQPREKADYWQIDVNKWSHNNREFIPHVMYVANNVDEAAQYIYDWVNGLIMHAEPVQ